MAFAARRSWAPAAAALLLALPLCALLGAVLALGSNQLSALAIAGIFGLLLLFVPSQHVVTLLLLLSFVAVGLAGYYLRISQVAWLPYALCLFLWLKLPIEALARRNDAYLTRATPAFLLALYAFMVIAVAATAVNQTPAFSALVGAKNYIFVWSVALLVASGAVDERYLRNAWIGVLLLAVLQAPFAVAQHLIQYGSSGNWDAVVGTFGGDPEGGGASGSMAIFLVIAIGTALVLMRERQVPLWFGALVVLASAVAIMMAEVKIVFFLLPVLLALVLLRDFVRRPLFALAAGAAVMALLFATGTYYRTTYFGENIGVRYNDATAYMNYALNVDTTPDFLNPRTGEVSRIGAPLLWAKNAGRAGVDKLFSGYGMTAARYSRTTGVGAAQRHHAFLLKTSTLTVLLWETGLLGAASFLAMLALAGWTAWRLSADRRIPGFHRAGLEASAGVFVVALLSTVYNISLIDGPSLQVFVAFVVGYVLFWYRRRPHLPAAASPRQP